MLDLTTGDYMNAATTTAGAVAYTVGGSGLGIIAQGVLPASMAATPILKATGPLSLNNIFMVNTNASVAQTVSMVMGSTNLGTSSSAGVLVIPAGGFAVLDPRSVWTVYSASGVAQTHAV